MLELLNDTKFGLNTTRLHDKWDALFAYDSMWLGALAMDMAETRLQNMTPSLTLGDFKYTGENSTIIKNAIYSSALNITFTGASVSNFLCGCLSSNNVHALSPGQPCHSNVAHERNMASNSTILTNGGEVIRLTVCKDCVHWGHSQPMKYWNKCSALCAALWVCR